MTLRRNAKPMITKTNHPHLLEHLTTAVVVLDDQLRLYYMNVAAEMLLETSGQRLALSPLEQIFHEMPSSLPALKLAMENGQPFTKREAEIGLVHGQKLTVDYMVTPITGPDQSKQLLLEFLPCDRYLRSTRDEAQSTSQATSRLLIKGLAHEIKNPLGGIRGAAQLLSKALPSEEWRDYTDVIIQETDRLTNLVDRLLGSNRMPQIEPANIHEVLERVQQLVHMESLDSITFIRDYDPSLPELLLDREMMLQAVFNIIRNAQQALKTQSTPQGCIRLRTRPIRQFTIGHKRHRLVCQIEINDNGPGIPEDIKNTLFYPMISGRPEGTGLGLALTQTILSQHQGLIEFTSAPGNTTFTLYLPMA